MMPINAHTSEKVYSCEWVGMCNSYFFYSYRPDKNKTYDNLELKTLLLFETAQQTSKKASSTICCPHY